VAAETPGSRLFAAYFEAVVTSLLQTTGEDVIKVNEFRAFFESVARESDRSFGIVSHSYIDERLKELLSVAMDPEIPGGTDSLFGSLAPLGTSSARIQMATALRWISSGTYRNLTAIRKIRNEFAHNPFVVSFADGRIPGFLSSMVPTERTVCSALPELLRADSLTESQRFRCHTILVTVEMLMEVSVAPHAGRAGIPPLSPVGQDWDRLPPALQQLWNTATDLMAAVTGPPA
jgi:DNA-binding MltR family transcriptional regulator